MIAIGVLTNVGGYAGEVVECCFVMSVKEPDTGRKASSRAGSFCRQSSLALLFPPFLEKAPERPSHSVCRRLGRVQSQPARR